MPPRYSIEFYKAAEKQLKDLPKKEQKRIAAAIDQLADDPRPRGAKKLKGSEYWRTRVGNYRVIYEINDGKLIVTIIRIGDRKDVYD